MEDRRFPTIETPQDEYPAPAQGSETVNPAPEKEFSTPDPLQEFDQTSGITEERKKESAFKRLRRIRKLMYGAAAIALGFVLLTPKQSGKAGPSETDPAAVPSDTAVMPNTTAAAVLTAEATRTPAPTPVPADTPVPEPAWNEPKIDPIFIGFSSEFYAWIKLIHPEAVRSVTAEMRERNLDEQIASYTWEEGDPAIETGLLDIPAFYGGDFYFAHMDYYSKNNLEPEPEMRVTVRYTASDGVTEESINLTAQPAPEEGVFARYWGNGPSARNNGYPDSFEVGTYSESDSWRFVIDRPDLVTEPGIFSVSAECGGRKVTEAECRIETVEPDPEILALGFNSKPNVILLIPRPDWMPESGTLTMKITQYLGYYGRTLTKTLQIDFSDRTEDNEMGTVVGIEIGER